MEMHIPYVNGFFPFLPQSLRITDTPFLTFHYNNPRFLKGNGHKLKTWDHHQNIREQFFTVQVKPWLWLPREATDFPPLEMFKSHLHIVLGNWFCMSPFEIHLDFPSNLNYAVTLWKISLYHLVLAKYCPLAQCCTDHRESGTPVSQASPATVQTQGMEAIQGTNLLHG